MAALQSLLNTSKRLAQSANVVLPQARALSYVTQYRGCPATEPRSRASGSIDQPMSVPLANAAAGSTVTGLLSQHFTPVTTVIQVRHKVRDYWPFPKEWKRIRVSGYDRRRLTIKGRAEILRKMIKGKWILAH